MSRRPGVSISVRHPQKVSDTKKFDREVSAHIGVFWPVDATDDQIKGALRDAMARTLVAIGQRRDEVASGIVPAEIPTDQYVGEPEEEV